MPWRERCRARAEAEGLGAAVTTLLEAFPRGVEDEDVSLSRWLGEAAHGFLALESAGLAATAGLGHAIVERLGEEVSQAAAQDQARRFIALVRGLGELDPPEARILRVALLACMSEVLGQRERRRSRVRDLIDFHYGHAAVLLHRRPGLPSPCDRVRQARWRTVGAGLEHATVAGHTSLGPMHVNLLRAHGPRLHVVHRHEAAVPLERLVREAGAIAGISGGFTLSSAMDIEAPSDHADPVGLLLRDGEVCSPPVLRRACLLDGPRGLEIEIVGPVGLRVELAGVSYTIEGCDDEAAIARGPAVFRRTAGSHGPAHDGWSLALLGTRTIAVARGALPIPKAGMVLTLPAGVELSADARRAGARVRYGLPRAAQQGVAAGPMLVHAGGRGPIDLLAEDFSPAVPPYTFAADETAGQNLLPRMVAGLTASGALVLVAIDGRDFARAVGMTLAQCAELLEALGCVRGMNLDGGDSKRMVVEGRVVDLPGGQLEWDRSASHPSAMRPVYSAVLLRPA